MINLKCNICQKECKTVISLAAHLVKLHKISTQKYYDDFLKNSLEGVCKVCKQPSKFKNLSEGYRTTCSHICSRKLMSFPESRMKANQTCLNRYGVENVGVLDWVKEKISNTQVKRLLDPKEREIISVATKKAMQREDVKRNHLNAVTKPKSQETLKKLSDAAKQRFVLDPTLKSRIYTNERNEKISKFKIEYWKNNINEKKRVGNIWKLWKSRDEDGWRTHLLRASQLGFKKIFTNNGETKLEVKMYKFLNDNNIKYIPQYEIEYKLYDAYLPDYNVLVEFDGEFWHKQSLKECKYPFQKNSFYNDMRKNEIAEKHGIPLFRIRENEPPEKILEYLNI